MEEIKIKNKTWTILEVIKEDRLYKVQRKKKLGLLKKFKSESDEFLNFLDFYKRLKIANVRMPKVLVIDKNNSYVVVEYLQGELVLDLLLKDNLTEKIYSDIFEQDWLARYEKITLNFYPENWLISNDKLYYLPFVFSEGVDENKTFEKYYIRYWFFSKEFVKHAESLNKIVDKSRLKDEYQLNKDIVLTTIKHHII